MEPDDRNLALLDRLLAGECSAEEASEVRAWLTAHPDHQAALEFIRAVRDTAHARPSLKGAEAAWRDALTRMEADAAPAPDRPAPTFSFERLGRGGPRPWVTPLIAAMLLLTVGSALVPLLRRPAPLTVPPVPRSVTYQTLHGQRLQLRLPDGTSVLLAPGSRLTPAADYGRASRHVVLEGQAYFTVAHDAMLPFDVQARDLVARDLGTRFLVRSYDDERTSEVVVAEGLVGVTPGDRGADSLSDESPDSALAAQVHAGELARVGADGRVERGRADLALRLAWTEGRLVFQDTPLREVVQELSRWYDVDITLADPTLGTRTLRAEFRDQLASQALAALAATLDLKLERSGASYRLTGQLHNAEEE